MLASVTFCYSFGVHLSTKGKSRSVNRISYNSILCDRQQMTFDPSVCNVSVGPCNSEKTMYINCGRKLDLRRIFFHIYLNQGIHVFMTLYDCVISYLMVRSSKADWNSLSYFIFEVIYKFCYIL